MLFIRYTITYNCKLVNLEYNVNCDYNYMFRHVYLYFVIV